MIEMVTWHQNSSQLEQKFCLPVPNLAIKPLMWTKKSSAEHWEKPLSTTKWLQYYDMGQCVIVKVFGCQCGAVFICVLQDTARWRPDPPLLIAAVKHGGDAASQGCCCCWCALHIPHNNHMHIHHVTVTLVGLLTAPRRVPLCLNVIPVLPYGCRHHHSR